MTAIKNTSNRDPYFDGKDVIPKTKIFFTYLPELPNRATRDKTCFNRSHIMEDICRCVERGNQEE